MSARNECVMALIIILLIFSAVVSGGEQPEYWAQHNKDGHWRNSGTCSLEGDLQIRWGRLLKDLRSYSVHNSQPAGQRSNAISIRNGRILVVVPPMDPDPGATGKKATFGILCLNDGSVLNTVITPHTGGGGVVSNAGVMGSDTPVGVINHYWKEGGRVFTAHGSDIRDSRQFDAYTGQLPFGAVEESMLPVGCNASGYFAMSNSNPLIYAHGSSGHSAFAAISFGLIGYGSGSSSSMAWYAPFVVEGDWVYPLGVMNKVSDGVFSGEGYGVRIKGIELQADPYSATTQWTYEDADKGFLTFGNVSTSMGSLRAYCLGEDGRVYYYGYHTTGSGTGQEPDFSQGTVLVGIQADTGSSDLEIGVSYNPEDESSYTGFTVADNLLPQIAASGNTVVVFQPQGKRYSSDISYGHIFCFDTSAKTFSWGHDFGAGYFNTSVSKNYYHSPEQAVQMTIAGDSAYVVEPFSDGGILKLRVEQFLLSDGSHTTTVLTAEDEFGSTIPVNDSTTLWMREVAAVDGYLVCQVDVDLFHQAVIVIEGDTNPSRDFMPVAVISAPATGTPLHEIFTDYPPAPGNQYDTGVSIQFESGSIDPDGGTLTYLWDFGDGNTSTEENPLYTYSSTGSAPSVTDYTVTLTVTDDEANTSTPAVLELAIRDVGAAARTVLQAEADAYVNSYSSYVDTNYGSAETIAVSGSTSAYKRGYVRFDTSSVDTSQVVSATLRLWSEPNTWLAYYKNRLHVRGTSDTWGESTITWNNAPAPGGGLGGCQFEGSQGRNYSFSVDVPVTGYVQSSGGDGYVSFALEMVNDSGSFSPSSREGGHAPELILQIGDPGCTGPQITSEPEDVATTTDDPTAPISITATSPLGEEYLTYHWYKVSGPGTITCTPNHTNDAKQSILEVSTITPGIYTFQCVVYDGFQTAVSREATVIAGNIRPVADADVSPLEGFIPLDILFDASLSSDDDGTVVSYLWDFGDGTTSTDISGLHTYTEAGYYEVCLSVTDDSGSVGKAFVYVKAFASGGGTNTWVLQQGLNAYEGCKDTYFYSGDYDFGAQDLFKVSNSKNGLLSFDIDGILPVDATVEHATLSLYCADHNYYSTPGATELTFYYVTHQWTEGTTLVYYNNQDGATWNEWEYYDGLSTATNNWTTPGGDYEATAGAQCSLAEGDRTGQWIDADVTAMVQNWFTGAKTNYGMIIKRSSTVYTLDFYSRNFEGDISLRPKLIIEFTVDGGGDNSAPVVDAGPDQGISLPASAVLDGTVTDDGLPDPPATVTVEWTKTSGPGTVTFGDANAVDTTASFSEGGTYVLKLTADDSELTGSDEVTITVNTPPAAADDATSTPQDTAKDIDVLANDTDADSDPLSVSSVTQPSNGTVVNNGSNVTYTPNAGYTGIDTFTYTANDGTDDSNSATVTVTVTSGNTAPVVNAGPDQGISLPANAVLDGTVTDDGLPDPPATVTVEWSKTSGPGTVTFGDANAVDTTASFSEGGTYVLKLTADDSALTGSDEVTITVNTPPAAADDATSTPQDTPKDIDVLANDTDADSDPLTVSSVTQPANGTVVNNGTDVTYTPNAGYTGIDTFTYTASDGRGGTDTAIVTVTVTESGDDDKDQKDDDEDTSFGCTPAAGGSPLGSIIFVLLAAGFLPVIRIKTDVRRQRTEDRRQKSL